MEEHAERRVGTTLKDKWKLERLLGTGGMAAVYVGVHKIGRRDAIKILHPEVARNADLRARFEQEAHAANRFRHPGAVEIRDIDVAEDGAPFLVMELLDGESLSARARRLNGEIPYPQLLRWMDELLDVLAAAHAQGIIHRDVKLDNLFVTSDERLKVLDFGIARIRDGARLMRTRWGATLGTTPYMPPEQALGLEVDARADLFAVGATMFRILARRRIHEANGDAELLAKMATEPAPALASVAPAAPGAACMVVDRALAFAKERRYPDALTMQKDVRALLAQQSPPYATARLSVGDAPASSSAAPTPVAAARMHAADAPTAAAPSSASAVTRDGPTRVTGASPVAAPPEANRPRSFPPTLAATSPSHAQTLPFARVPDATDPRSRSMGSAPTDPRFPTGAPPAISIREAPPSQGAYAGPASQPASVPYVDPRSRPGGPMGLDRTLPSEQAARLPFGANGIPSPPPAPFGAPAIAVIDAPPPASIAMSQRSTKTGESKVIPLVMVGVLFLVLGAGIAFLLTRSSSDASNAPVSATSASAVVTASGAPTDAPLDTSGPKHVTAKPTTTARTLAVPPPPQPIASQPTSSPPPPAPPQPPPKPPPKPKDHGNH